MTEWKRIDEKYTRFVLRVLCENHLAAELYIPLQLRGVMNVHNVAVGTLAERRQLNKINVCRYRGAGWQFSTVQNYNLESMREPVRNGKRTLQSTHFMGGLTVVQQNRLAHCYRSNSRRYDDR